MAAKASSNNISCINIADMEKNILSVELAGLHRKRFSNKIKRTYGCSIKHMGVVYDVDLKGIEMLRCNLRITEQ